MKKYTEVNLPFQGFYCSVHEAQIDSTLEQDAEYLEDEKGVSNAMDELLKVYDHSATCKEYIRRWLGKYWGWLECNTEMCFDIQKDTLEMQSPREYNFETDRLFVKVATVDLLKLWKLTRHINKEALEDFEKLVQERFTSRSGFFSHYSNDWREWGEPCTWDHNQWGTLLMSWQDDDDIFYDIEVEVQYKDYSLFNSTNTLNLK